MDIITFIIVVVCGFAIGILSGMFGIGGGGLIVPLLHMAFGLPITAATSTSLLTIAPTGISGSIKHIRQKTLSLKMGLIVGGFGALASVASSLIADKIPDYMVVIITVVVILFSVGMMIRTMLMEKRVEDEAAKEASAKEAVIKEAETATGNLSESATGSTVIQETGAAADSEVGQAAAPAQQDSAETKLASEMQESKAVSFLVPMIVGLIAGGIAGIVGVGGGFIIVPFCVAYLGFSLKKAAGTSLVSIAIIAIPGIITHALLGHIWWLYGLAIIIGTIPGAQIGAWLIAKLPERPMRAAFAVLLTLIGLMMLAQEFMF